MIGTDSYIVPYTAYEIAAKAVLCVRGFTHLMVTHLNPTRLPLSRL